jgi:hypothetical protein
LFDRWRERRKEREGRRKRRESIHVVATCFTTSLGTSIMIRLRKAPAIKSALDMEEAINDNDLYDGSSVDGFNRSLFCIRMAALNHVIGHMKNIFRLCNFFSSFFKLKNYRQSLKKMTEKSNEENIFFSSKREVFPPAKMFSLPRQIL